MSSFTTSSIITIVTVDNQVSNGPYSIGFEFLDESHIKVQRVDTGIDLDVTNYTVDKTNNQITFLDLTLAAGNQFRVRRATDLNTPVSTFFPGSSIRSQDLNNNFTQTLFALQEEDQQNLSKVGDTLQGSLSLDNSYRITNVPAPTANDHVVNKLYVDNKLADSSTIVQAAQNALDAQASFEEYWAGAHAVEPASVTGSLGRFYFNTTDRALYFLAEVDGVRQWVRSTQTTVPTKTFKFTFSAGDTGNDVILPATYATNAYQSKPYLTGTDDSGNKLDLPSTGTVIIQTRNSVSKVFTKANSGTDTYRVVSNGLFTPPDGEHSGADQAIIFNNADAIDAGEPTTYTIIAFGDAVFGPQGIKTASFVTGTDNGNPTGKIRIEFNGDLDPIETSNLLPRFAIGTVQVTDAAATGENAPSVTVTPSTVETNLSTLGFKLPYQRINSITTDSNGIPTYTFSTGDSVTGNNSIVGPQGKFLSNLSVINNSDGTSTVQYAITDPNNNNSVTTTNINNLNLKGPKGDTSTLGQATAHFVGDADFSVTLPDNSTATYQADQPRFILSKAKKRTAVYKIELTALGSGGSVVFNFTPQIDQGATSGSTVARTIDISGAADLAAARTLIKNDIDTNVSFVTAEIIGDDIIIRDNQSDDDATYVVATGTHTGSVVPTATSTQLVTYAAPIDSNGTAFDYDMHVVLPNFDIDTTVTTNSVANNPTASVAYDQTTGKWKFTIESKTGATGQDADVVFSSTIASGTPSLVEQSGSTAGNRSYQLRLPDKWHVVSSPPAGSLGVIGDMAYDSVHHVFYGPKTNNAHWPTGDRLKEVTNVEYIDSTHADAGSYEGSVKITFNTGDPVYTSDIRQTNQLTDSDFSGTSGFLKKTGAGTYELDTNTYLTSETSHTDVVVDGDFSNASSGFLKKTSNGVYTVDSNTYLTSETSHTDVVVDGDFSNASSGFLKKTSNGVYTVDSNTYLTSETSHADVVVDGDFGSASDTGFLKKTGDGAYNVDSNTYVADPGGSSAGLLARDENGNYSIDDNNYLTGLGNAVIDPGSGTGLLSRGSDGTYSVVSDSNDNTTYDMSVADDTNNDNKTTLTLRADSDASTDDDVVIVGESVNNNSIVRVEVNTNSEVEIGVNTMGAATSSDAGRKGLVPAPAAGQQLKFLRGDGTWATGSATLSTQSGLTYGTYGDANTVAQFTVDDTGIITAASNVDIGSLSAGAITSGTFSVDQIPNLDASKINSGTFNANQIPALDYLASNGNISLGGNLDTNNYDIIATGQNAADGIDLKAETAVYNFYGYSDPNAGIYNDAALKLFCSVGSHAIVIKSPPHASGASYTLVLPPDNGNANEVLKTDGNGNLDWVAQNSYNVSSWTADGTNPGTAPGLVPTAANAADNTSFLRGDGTWQSISVSSLDSLTDVSISNPQGGNILAYNAGTSTWEVSSNAGLQNLADDSSPELGGQLIAGAHPTLHTTGEIKTFVVTVGTSTTGNRYKLNSDHNDKSFFFDGEETPYIVLTPGMTYRFDQSAHSNYNSSNKEILYFSETLDGPEYTPGVTYDFKRRWTSSGGGSDTTTDLGVTSLSDIAADWSWQYSYSSDTAYTGNTHGYTVLIRRTNIVVTDDTPQILYVRSYSGSVANSNATENYMGGKLFMPNAASVSVGMNGLTDATITSVADNNFLKYNATSSQWENTLVNLGDLNDISAASPSTNDFLRWNGTNWVNASVSIPTVTQTSTDTFTNKTLKHLIEEVYAIASANAGNAFDPDNGPIQTLTLTANTTFAAASSNWDDGQSMVLMLTCGSYSPTWTTMNPTWVGGSAPQPPLTGAMVLEFWKVGTTIYGAHVGDV